MFRQVYKPCKKLRVLTKAHVPRAVDGSTGATRAVAPPQVLIKAD